MMHPVAANNIKQDKEGNGVKKSDIRLIFHVLVQTYRDNFKNIGFYK
jgi:hypothetical protein